MCSSDEYSHLKLKGSGQLVCEILWTLGKLANSWGGAPGGTFGAHTTCWEEIASPMFIFGIYAMCVSWPQLSTCSYYA